MASPQPVPFGTLLKRYRRAAGLTQEDLAARSGYSAAYISELERGVRLPTRATLAALAEALALPPAERAALEAVFRPPAAPLSARVRPTSLPVDQPPLVGRAHELAHLEQHLAGQGPPLLLLAGEPGIGKSRLLHATAERVVMQGWTVLEGGCHRRSGQEPYVPLLPALASHLRQQSAAQQRVSLEGCAWLVRLLPELAEQAVVPLPRWTLPPEQERRLMFAAVARYLANVAGPAGTLLVLDDLQWAGADAVDLLASLLRAPGTPSLRVLGAYRSTEADPSDPPGVVLADLGASGLASEYQVGPLAPPEARELLRGMLEERLDVDEELRAQLLLRTGGVPYFLVSCAQALRTDVLEGAGSRVPWNVAQSIRQRVTVLSQAAQDVLGAAAVVGREAPGALLLKLAAQPAVEVLAALEALDQARLLVEGAEARYEFPHDLIREVVLADLSMLRQRHWHLQIAQMLEQGPGELPIEQLAYHYSRARESEKALIYLEHAGDLAERMQAHTEAGRAYQDALTWLGDLEHTADRARVQLKVGKVFTTLMRCHEALEALEDAVNCYRQVGDQEGYWHALAQIGRTHARQASYQRGVARLLPVLEPWKDREWSPALADAQVALAELYFNVSKYQEQLLLTEHVVQLAEATNHQELLVKARHWRSKALIYLGRLEEGAHEAEESVALAEAIGDLWDWSRLLNGVAGFYWMKGNLEQCRHYQQRALESAERMSDPSMITYMLNNLAGLHFTMGRWEDARVGWMQAVTKVYQMSGLWGGVYSLLGLAQLRLAEGEETEAAQLFEEAITLAERRDNWEARRLAQTALAERDLLHGNPQAAYTRLAPLLDHPSQQGIGKWYFVHLVAWALLDTEKERAEALLAPVIAEARDQEHWNALVDLLRVQSQLLMQQRRWQEAQALLEEALALCRAMPYPWAEAKTLYVFGRLYQAKGEPDEARKRLEAALAILNRLGERLYAEQVERALAKLGSQEQQVPS